MPLPLRPDELDPAWLTQVLHDAGVLPTGEVRSLSATRIGVGRGFASELYRITLDYAGAPRSAPASVVAKLPPGVESMRQLLALFGFDRREVGFYRELAPGAPIATPRCHLAALDVTGSGVLVLEDLADATARPQVEGASEADAVLAVETAARLHAHFWDDPRVPRLPWLAAGDASRYAVVAAMYQQRLGSFLGRTADWLPDVMRERIADIGTELPRLAARSTEPHCTLVHGDYRLENLLFAADDPALHVLDWQLCGWTAGAYDLAYFFAGSLPDALRQRLQASLLERYHALLCQHGVTGYDFAALERDFRTMLLASTAVVVNLAGSVDAMEQSAAGADDDAEHARTLLPGIRDLFDLMARRTVSAILDNDALALL